MMPTRKELEREVLSLRDRLEVALSSTAAARSMILSWVSEDVKKSSEYKRLLSLVTAVAKESPVAVPLLARLGWQQGMKEARALVLEVAGKSEDSEWKASAERFVEELDRKLNANM